MKQQINELPSVTEKDLHNLEILKELFEYGETFTTYAKSINDLFYFYIQHCVDKTDEIFLTQSDVYNINEIVNALQSLK